MSDYDHCKHPDIIKEDWYKVCTECGLTWEPPFFEPPKILTRAPRVRTTPSKYSRVSNFEQHLKQLKGDLNISDDQYDEILEVKKSFNNKEVSYKTLKSYLKKEKKNKYYPLIPSILKKFWGVSLVETTKEEDSKLSLKFIKFERKFDLVDKGSRKNSLSYDFLIRQFLEEAGNPSFVNVPTLSDKKKRLEVKALYDQVLKSQLSY
jgi:hypothetical protein